ncbi:hypothetical protein AB1K44_16605, partial [Vibrio cholerae]
LALSINQQLILDALPYLEVRHLLVHADGKVSQEFINKYPKIKLKGDSVFINYVFIDRMRKSVRPLIAAIDAEVIAKKIVDTCYTQP